MIEVVRLYSPTSTIICCTAHDEKLLWTTKLNGLFSLGHESSKWMCFQFLRFMFCEQRSVKPKLQTKKTTRN